MDIFKKQIFTAALQLICDGGYTPYMKVRNPPEFPICGGTVNLTDDTVLNISAAATREFKIANDTIYFIASFRGVDSSIVCPIANVISIFAKEDPENINVNLESYSVIPPLESEKKTDKITLATIEKLVNSVSKVLSASFTFKPISLNALRDSADRVEPTIPTTVKYGTPEYQQLLDKIAPFEDFGTSKDVPFSDPGINHRVMSDRNQRRIKAYANLHKDKPHRHLHSVK